MKINWMRVKWPRGPVRHMPMLAAALAISAYIARPNVVAFIGVAAVVWLFLWAAWGLFLGMIGAQPMTPRLRTSNQIGWYRSFCYRCRNCDFTSDGEFFYPKGLGSPLATIVHKNKPIWFCRSCKRMARYDGYDPLPEEYQEITL